jgi:Lrp/AsnC family transcriptional regulator, leucine-responsive regulatory protein
MSAILLNGGFDQLDLAILQELQVNGRISIADLGRKIHLSPPAVYQRIKRLERAGVIKQYVALLDPETLGYGVLCFIKVSIQPHTKTRMVAFQEHIAALPEVLECYHTAGSHDLLLKVVATNNRALDQFIADHLMTLAGVDRIETNVVLSQMKSSTVLKV